MAVNIWTSVMFKNQEYLFVRTMFTEYLFVRTITEVQRF